MQYTIVRSSKGERKKRETITFHLGRVRDTLESIFIDHGRNFTQLFFLFLSFIRTVRLPYVDN